MPGNREGGLYLKLPSTYWPVYSVRGEIPYEEIWDFAWVVVYWVTAYADSVYR
jgi:hypothetical protein